MNSLRENYTVSHPYETPCACVYVYMHLYCNKKLQWQIVESSVEYRLVRARLERVAEVAGLPRNWKGARSRRRPGRAVRNEHYARIAGNSLSDTADNECRATSYEWPSMPATIFTARKLRVGYALCFMIIGGRSCLPLEEESSNGQCHGSKKLSLSFSLSWQRN